MATATRRSLVDAILASDEERRKLLSGLMKDPIDYPEEMKGWVPRWIEANPPQLPMSAIVGTNIPAVTSIANDGSRVGEMVHYTSNSTRWIKRWTGSAWETVAVGNPPAARVYNNASIGSIATITWTALTFNSERYDTDTIHSTSSNTSRLTATTAGLYHISGHVEWDSDTAGTKRAVAIVHSASSYIGIQAGPPIANLWQSVATHWKMAANDYVELQVFHDSGTNRTINAAAQPYSPEFAMTYVGEG